MVKMLTLSGRVLLLLAQMLFLFLFLSPGLSLADGDGDSGDNEIGGVGMDNNAEGDQDGNLFDSRDAYGDLDFEDADIIEDGLFEESDSDVEDEFHTTDFAPSHVFTFEVDRGKEECFYEEIANAPIKMRGAYFVSSAAQTAVTLTVKFEDAVLKRLAGKSQDVFSHTAEKNGVYSFCFFGSSATEVVTFAIHVGVKVVEHVNRDHLTPLENSVRSMHHAIRQLVAEQNFLVLRTKAHMETQDEMESRVAWYTIFETVFMASVTIGQVYYVRRLINNRQWV